MPTQRLVGYGNPITDRPTASAVPGMMWVDYYGRTTFSDGAVWRDVLYDDWRWAGSGVNPPGAPDAATLTEIQTNQWCWQFINNRVMVFPDQQIPHDYKEGTDIQPHIHFAPTTTATYTGTWTMVTTDWLEGATGTARSVQQTLTAAFNSAMTAHQMQTINFNAVMPGAGRKISAMSTITLSLSLSAGPAVYLLGFDGHYQKDALGSIAITGKDG